MVLPTSAMAASGTPSRRRLSTASSQCTSRSSARRSVMMRLISSGIVRSPERRPASRCATGTPSLAAARVAPSVELTSPGTTMAAGGSGASTASTPRDDGGGLRGLRARADAEVVGRLRQAELLQERAGQRAVVVLARVQDLDGDVGLRAQGVADRCDLDEVRPRADDDHHPLHGREASREAA